MDKILDKELARFGHTINRINHYEYLVFGGAIENNENTYVTTNDTTPYNGKEFKVSQQDVGVIPSNRAAHSTAKIEENEILMFGGAFVGGTLAKEQLYHLKIENYVGKWNELETDGPRPGRRYGHTLLYNKPNLILFGGSTGSQTINETWILNLMDTTFVWVRIQPDGLIPAPRVYHSADICRHGGAEGMMIIYGGRDVTNKTCKEIWGLRKHRDGRWDWTKPSNQGNTETGDGRYQHISLYLGSLLINVGGKVNESVCNASISIYDYEEPKWYVVQNVVECFRHVCWIDKSILYIHGGLDTTSKILDYGKVKEVDLLSLFGHESSLCEKIKKFVVAEQNPPQMISPLQKQSKPSTAKKNQPQQVQPKTKKVPIKVFLQPKMGKQEQNNPLADYFIEYLLRPSTYSNTAPDQIFKFSTDEINTLCDFAENVVREQSILMRVISPCKIFGDIHGQYSDLMRFFHMLGGPCNPEIEGGINQEDNYNYVFLGDYVDRGVHSLETICLLMALKVKYPTKIVLLRGNHEDRWINTSFGFLDECESRLAENAELPGSVFNRINNFFEWLPLGAVIDDNIICLHGGIGSSLHKLQQIEQIERPLEVVHEVQTPREKLVVDILWSDPTDDDSEYGVQPNYVRDPHGTGNIVKFGPDVVKKFLATNNLAKIVRAHECVMDGFERFAGGDLITVFSATDYCGKHKNAGAVLIITKKFGIAPKLIYPTMNQTNWAEDNDKRPPTPPRWTNSPEGNY